MYRKFLIMGKWLLVAAILRAACELPALAQGPLMRTDYRSRGYQPGVEPQPEPTPGPTPWTVDSPYYEWQSPYYQGKNDYGPGLDWRSGQPSAEDDWEYGGEWRRRWDRAHAPVYSGAFGLFGGEYYVNGNGPTYYYGQLDRYAYEGTDNQNPYNDADYYFAQATRSFSQGEYSVALKLAAHAEIEEPRDPQIHLLETLSMLALADYRGAAVKAHSLAAMSQLPSWNEIYQYYGDARPYTHQMRALEVFVRSHGADPDGRFLLGVLYMMGGYRDAAARELQVASRLAPFDRYAARLLVRAAPEMAPRLAYYAYRPTEPPPNPARPPAPPQPGFDQRSLGYQSQAGPRQPADAREPVDHQPSFPQR
jgi:hypothetical protein